MYKSQFRKIDTYDWFCGPGSRVFYKISCIKSQMTVNSQKNIHFNHAILEIKPPL